MLPSNEEETLKQFREEIFAEGILNEGDSLGTNNETLLRFLRARKFDINASKKMMRNCQEWRATAEGMGIDALYKQMDPLDYPGRDAVNRCWPITFHKTDKKGRPLNIHTFGNIDFPELYKHITPEDHWKSMLVNAEYLSHEVLPAASRKAGKPISNVLGILDLESFGLSQFWQMRNMAKRGSQISQDYFPETFSLSTLRVHLPTYGPS